MSDLTCHRCGSLAKGYLAGEPCCRQCGEVPELDELGEFSPDYDVIQAMRFSEYDSELFRVRGAWSGSISSGRYPISGSAFETTPGEALSVACRRYKIEVARYINESKTRNEEVT